MPLGLCSLLPFDRRNSEEISLTEETGSFLGVNEAFFAEQYLAIALQDFTQAIVHVLGQLKLEVHHAVAVVAVGVSRERLRIEMV